MDVFQTEMTGSELPLGFAAISWRIVAFIKATAFFCTRTYQGQNSYAGRLTAIGYRHF
jgi:hypothetical protein